MRNTFVVLVSLFIGVASRFIVPSTVSEISISSSAPNNQDQDITIKANSTTEVPTHNSELPNNRTNIDEKALYEHAAGKQNNQSERAFIYINQKYKKPSSYHNYFKIAHNEPEISSRYQQTKAQAIILQRHNEPCKSEPAQANFLFHGHDFPIRTQDISSYFGSSSLYNCNNEPLNYNYKGNYERIENFNQYNRLANDRREYIELLKSPLLRPLNRGRPKYDAISTSHFSPLSYYDFLKLERRNKQHNAKANILVDEGKTELRRNYGFNSAYGQQNVYQTKGLLHRVEDPHFDGEFINDEEAAQVASIEKTQDEDKLLDQYLKETLEDQVTSKEKPVIANDCSYRDCILLSTKTSSSVGHQKISKNPDCKCGHRLKLIEATIPRDRQEREESKYNQTKKYYPSKSDDNYYEEILTKDTTNTKHARELITMLNNTLRQ